MQDPDSTRRAIASLGRLTDLFRERRRQLARQAGLPETQWQLLEEIAGEDFMPSLFARRRACTPAAVSRTLRQLLDRDLITAQISREDARQRVYRLTGAGRRVLAGMRRRRERAIAAVWEQFDPADIRRFASFSEALGRSLEEYAESSATTGSA